MTLALRCGVDAATAKRLERFDYDFLNWGLFQRVMDLEESTVRLARSLHSSL